MSRHRMLAALLALAAASATAPLAARAQQVQTSQRPGEIPSSRPSMPPRDAGGQQQTIGTATIKGRIVDAETGAPLRRASVMVSARGQREPRGTTTDDQGLFEIRELPAGDYSVASQKAGYVRALLGQRRWNEPGRTVTIRDRETIDTGPIALLRGGVITGRIVDEIGDAVMDVDVRVMRRTWSRGKQRLSPVGGGQTNDLGIYRAYGLQPGEYYVSAASRGFGFRFGRNDTAVEYAPTFFPGATDPASARTVIVSAGQESLADIALIPTRVTKVSGIVMEMSGKPATGGNVAAIRRTDSEMSMALDGPRGAPIRADGSFTLTGMTPGTWTLMATTGGRGMGPQDGEREFAQMAVGVGDEDISSVVLVMGRGGSVRGRVTFEGVAPQDVSSLRVMSRPLDDGPGMGMFGGGRPTNVAADGTFELTGLSGPVTFFVMGGPSAWTVSAIRYGGRDVYDTGVDVPMGRTVTGVQIVMSQEQTTLTGTATDERGSPLKDFTVVAFADDREKWFLPSGRYLRQARANQDGIFTISGLAPGSYLVAALESIDSNALGDPEELERLRALASPVSLTEREQKNVTLKVAKP